MKQIVPLVILVLACLAGPVQAQAEPTLSSVRVGLWPEYDRSEMLVILRGWFASDASLPLSVEFRIPAGVGQPHAVAYVDANGQRLNQEYTTRVEGEWRVLSFSLSSPGFQIEYYAPLTWEGEQRTFTYTFRADYAVTSLDLEAQVPPTAQGFALNPAVGLVVQQDDGLAYHLATAGPLARGEMLSWTATYRKADTGLTVDALRPLPTSTEGGVPAVEEKGGSIVVIFVIAFIALVAVGAGAFWLGRRVEPARGTVTERPRCAVAGGDRAPLDDALFCHECGARLRPDADYCHKCGQAVRREE